MQVGPTGQTSALVDGRVRDDLDPRLTYCGLGVIDPRLFVGHAPGRFPLAPLLTRLARVLNG